MNCSILLHISSYENCCRTCLTILTDDSLKHSIFEENTYNKIMNFVTIDIVTEETCFPKFICNICIDKLKNVWDFKCQIEEAQNVLKQQCLQYSDNFDIKPEQYSIDVKETPMESSVKAEVQQRRNLKQILLSYQELKVKKEGLKKSVLCQSCNKRFPTKCGIKNGQKSVLCPNCSKEYLTKGILKLHLHTYGIKKNSNAFTTAACLANHMLTHTGEKKFFCSICGRGTRTLSDLKAHIRTHTGERPYECKFPDCDKKYKTWSALHTHKKTHTGEKNHQCTMCPKSFHSATCLKVHARTHTGEKPYVCSTCAAKFSQSGSLRHHMKIHSRNPSST
ncbi:hypothetical protein NQ318_019940 [Aromia moschata]|uniref:Uncharacterized protein n=1 Tax=Aromia moschata TaxID=1265417 RepID=A0AAV8Y866_9CUCU|nr:hypothetical protein NQ318_019940 [Aromia moschata]